MRAAAGGNEGGDEDGGSKGAETKARKKTRPRAHMMRAGPVRASERISRW